jgi:small-conductance mechanosensitive channel
MSDAWVATVTLIGATAAAVAAGTAAHLLTALFARKPDGVPALIRRYCHSAFIASLVPIAVLLALPHARLHGRLLADLRHASTLCLIAFLAWLLVKALFVVQDVAFTHVRVDVRDNRRARRVRTQIALLRRLTAVVVALIALASMLMTFDRFRTFGASLLASAGLVGVIAAAASQSFLKNMVAGLQLAFSDALRIDDVVVVEDEWGRVEQLNLMTVTLHLWDERRLVLPTSYFTENPFQNWTRTESRILGSVLLHVDYRAPLEEMREKAHEIVDSSPLWDRRDWVLQVVDATPTTMVLRILASAQDSASSWDLRCDIREGLLQWLQESHPDALPRVRGDVRDLDRTDTEMTRTADTEDRGVRRMTRV